METLCIYLGNYLIMSKIKLLPLFTCLLLIVVSGCKDKFTESFTANIPIYKSLEDWRSEAISMTAAQQPAQTGKIYLYEQYLLVNEPYLGVHFFDNSDPANPVNLGFLPVQGNIDMAVRDNRLYLDAYMDLLTFDISDINNPQQICRLEDAFTTSFPYHYPYGYDPALPIMEMDPAKGIIIGWKQEEVTQELNQTYYYAYGRGIAIDAATNGGFAGPQLGGPSAVGTGGSMAQFTIANDHLYTLESWQLTSYDLISGECPEMKNEIALNRNCETLFPARNHLFIGTTTGMLIYSMNNPANPSLVSEYDHINSCDPVAVQGNRAYVTLRTGNTCFGNVNQLLVIDVADLSSPQQLATYNFTNPHGLGIDGSTLFICDGPDGLKVFDASDDLQISQNMLSQFPQIGAFDVIPFNDVLISVAADGIYQYDYSDPLNIYELSHISTK